MRETDHAEISARQASEQLGELPTAGGVHALQEPPLPRRRQPEVVVGEPVGPVAAEDTHGQVFVDHQHRSASGQSGVVVLSVVAAEERIGGQVGVEGGLELVDEIARGHPSEQLTALGRQARVPGPAPAAAFLDELLADGHGFHCASDATGRHAPLAGGVD